MKNCKFFTCIFYFLFDNIIMRYKKFLLLGITAILGLNNLAAISSPEDIDIQAMAPIAEKIQIFKEEGILKDTSKITVVKVASDYNGKASAEAFTGTTGPNCDITVYTKDGNTVAFNTKNGITTVLEESLKLTNYEKELNTSKAILHELAHCKMQTEIKDIYKSGNEQIDEFLNTYHTTVSIGDKSTGQLMHEIFAETFAMINLINKYGNNGELQKVLNYTAKAKVMFGSLQRSDSYETPYQYSDLYNTLKEPNTLSEIMSLKSQKDITEYAQKLATKITLQVMKADQNLIYETKPADVIISQVVNILTDVQKSGIDSIKINNLSSMEKTAFKFFQQLPQENLKDMDFYKLVDILETPIFDSIDYEQYETQMNNLVSFLQTDNVKEVSIKAFDQQQANLEAKKQILSNFKISSQAYKITEEIKYQAQADKEISVENNINPIISVDVSQSINESSNNSQFNKNLFLSKVQSIRQKAENDTNTEVVYKPLKLK